MIRSLAAIDQGTMAALGSISAIAVAVAAYARQWRSDRLATHTAESIEWRARFEAYVDRLEGDVRDLRAREEACEKERAAQEVLNAELKVALGKATSTVERLTKRVEHLEQDRDPGT